MKQTNNAIKFLMAQYRAIFKNANIAMLAAIAASALAAGQANADPIANWGDLNDKTPDLDQTTKQLEVVGSGSVVNKNGFALNITSGAHTIKGNGTGAGIFTVEGKPSSITLLASNPAQLPTLSIGSGDANTNAHVTVDTVTNTMGTLNIEGHGADVAGANPEIKTSALNAKTIIIGGEGTKEADKAEVNVKGFASLNATGTADGEGLIVGKNGKLVIGVGDADKLAQVTGKIQINDGKVNFNGQKKTGAILGSESSTIVIAGGVVSNENDKGGTIQGSSITLKGTGNITAAHNIDVKGTFVGESGTITIENGKSGAFVGNSTLTGTKITNKTGALVIQGTSTFADGTLKVDANSGSTVLHAEKATDTSTLNVSAKELKSVLSGGLASSGAGVSVLDLSSEGQKTVDLASAGTGLLQDANGKVNAKVTVNDNTTLKIKGLTGKFTAHDALDGENNGSNGKKLILAFDDLTLGSGDFAINSGAGLEVAKKLKIKDGTAALTVNDSNITLAGSGTGKKVEAKSITLTGANAATEMLTVKSGEWEVSALTLTKGSAKIEKDGALTVTGKLSAADSSKLTVDAGGKLSTVGSGELAFKEAADSALTVNGKLELDEGDLLNNGTLKGEALKAAALAGKGTIKIDNNTALTADQFTALQNGFTNFKGLFEMNVDITAPETLTTTNAIGNLKTDKYDNKSLNVESSQTISKNYSVGNVVVKADEDLVLAEGGSLSLNNPDAQKGSGNFVSKTTANGTAVGNVKFNHADNTLTLAGTGKIGSITADGGNKGVVDVGNTDKAGHVTVVKGNSIGEQGKPVNDVNVVKGSLNVESGSIFANNFAMDAGTSVQVVGDITTKLLTVDGGLLSAKTLKLEGSAKDNTIAGGANVTLDSLTMGDNQALLVGEAGLDEELGSNAVVYTKSLKMGDTTSSIFVDPNYRTGASLFATENIGDNGSTVTGKVGIGSNSAFGVGFESMAAFQDVVGDYLTVKGGFDESGVKNALVLNKGITVESNNGITVDATLAKADYESKVIGNTVTLGEGAALVLTDKAFGADKTDAAIKFADTNNSGSIVVGNNYKVVLVGDFDANDNALKLAVKSGGAVADGLTNVKVEYAGGLLSGTYDSTTGGFNLEFHKDKADAIYDGISRPVADAIVAKLNGELKEKSAAGYGLFANLIAAENYKAIDATAHAATYAGAQQAAVAAVTTMADAMFGRVGAVGVEAASISATGSQANGGVWLTPMYKSVDSDGFNAEGASYGADVDLSGVAFGTDTVNGNMRFGAVFNIGSGDAEGKGNGNGLKDEFDYYGFGIYSAMGFGNFALVGDASYDRNLSRG